MFWLIMKGMGVVFYFNFLGDGVGNYILVYVFVNGEDFLSFCFFFYFKFLCLFYRDYG